MSETTKKQQHELGERDRKLLDELATSNSFWSSVRAGFANYGSLTDKQYAQFLKAKKEHDWKRNAREVAGKPVKNSLPLTGPVWCGFRDEPCETEATVAVGNWGYCELHAPAAAESLRVFIAAQNAKKAAEETL